MTSRRRYRGLVLALVAMAMAACERAPTEPAVDDSDLSTLVSGETGPFAPSPITLPQLFRSAVVKVEAEQGRQAALEVLSSWQQLNEEARAALQRGDRQTAQARAAAVRAEEIRVVLRVLGNSAAHRVIEEVGVRVEEARQALAAAQAEGHDVSTARPILQRVGELRDVGNAALAAGSYAVALDQGTQAAAMLDGVVHFVIGLHRIGGLEVLFDQAVAQVGRTQGREAVARLLQPLNALDQQARAALRAGDRESARVKLEALRAAQVQITLRVLGTDVVAPLLRKVDQGVAALRTRVEALELPRRERAVRMLAEASDMNARAKAALTAGNHAVALDLGSHAAGLLNALHHLTPH